MTTIIRAAIEGTEAEPGHIAAADVARLITGLERAIARAAYVALGRQRRAVAGRHNTAVERASRLRFVGVERGSFVELLALPDASEPGDDELPITVEALGNAAFDQLLAALSGADENSLDRQLAAAVAQLADELGVGERTDRITIGYASVAVSRHAVIDSGVRASMHRVAQLPPPERSDVLVGRLVEADFERLTARLQPPAGKPVTVRFPDELADEIHEALRQVATLEGLVSYDPKTSVASSVRLRAISRSEQLALAVGDLGTFWQHATFEDLQRSQGVTSLDVGDLYDADLDEEERAALYAALMDD
ncbi:MAG TPA: hypothetical protein VMU51_34740 [Mycobacteriales bacterium]|nr:hypothetical protein [Mycobacteriales bacterium]